MLNYNNTWVSAWLGIYTIIIIIIKADTEYGAPG